MSKMRIEDVIAERLTGDARQNALDFAKFLHANEITLEGNDDGSGWAVGGVAGGSLGYMMMDGGSEFPGPWTMWFNACDFDESGSVDDALKETAWAHASICGHFESGGKHCGCGDQPGFTRVIFGKTYENRCHSPLMFANPDADTLRNMQRLMLLLT